MKEKLMGGGVTADGTIICADGHEIIAPPDPTHTHTHEIYCVYIYICNNRVHTHIIVYIILCEFKVGVTVTRATCRSAFRSL